MPNPEALEELYEAAKWLTRHRDDIKADIRSGHFARGPGASTEMREDDRDFRRDLSTALDKLAAALLKAEQPQSKGGDSSDRARPHPLLERAFEVVHHDADCLHDGRGDAFCTCDAVPFLNDLERTLKAEQPPAGEGGDRAEARIVGMARQALFRTEMARTGVVNPVNGSAPYSYVEFHGQRARFDDGEFTIQQHRDAGTGQAAAYAQKINDALFELAKTAARLAATPDPLSIALQGWQPIETAPKDGMRMNLCWKADAGLSAHVELGKWSASNGWCNTYGKPFHGDPDYYQLLPAPPESTIREIGGEGHREANDVG